MVMKYYEYDDFGIIWESNEPPKNENTDGLKPLPPSCIRWLEELDKEVERLNEGNHRGNKIKIYPVICPKHGIEVLKSPHRIYTGSRCHKCFNELKLGSHFKQKNPRKTYEEIRKEERQKFLDAEELKNKFMRLHISPTPNPSTQN